jgi:hypothetical protein
MKQPSTIHQHIEMNEESNPSPGPTRSRSAPPRIRSSDSLLSSYTDNTHSTFSPTTPHPNTNLSRWASQSLADFMISKTMTGKELYKLNQNNGNSPYVSSDVLNPNMSSQRQLWDVTPYTSNQTTDSIRKPRTLRKQLPQSDSRRSPNIISIASFA